MPGGHPYFLMVSPDFCESCDQPLCDHDRERVYPDDGPSGSYHYEYFCPNGGRAQVPRVEAGE